MAKLRFRCPHCSRKIEVDERGAGLEVPCPECHRNIEIPTQEEAQRLAERQKMDTQPIAALPTMRISLSGRKRMPRYSVLLGVLILVCVLGLLRVFFPRIIPSRVGEKPGLGTVSGNVERAVVVTQKVGGASTPAAESQYEVTDPAADAVKTETDRR
jgi:hypothetical protein